jgi:hypothetical protein
MTSTFARVPAHTCDDVNQQIQDDIAANARYYAAHVDEIPGRVHELEEEWDIERAIEANASAPSAGTTKAYVAQPTSRRRPFKPWHDDELGSTIAIERR